MKTNRSERGLTVLELLVTVTLFAIFIVIAVPSLKAFFQKIEIKNGIRTVTAALNTARCRAVTQNARVKIVLQDNHLVLKEKRFAGWQVGKTFDPGDKVELAMKGAPVFYPEGYAVPLFSVYVKSEVYNYRVSMSLAGRIKVSRL